MSGFEPIFIPFPWDMYHGYFRSRQVKTIPISELKIDSVVNSFPWQSRKPMSKQKVLINLGEVKWLKILVLSLVVGIVFYPKTQLVLQEVSLLSECLTDRFSLLAVIIFL